MKNITITVCILLLCPFFILGQIAQVQFIHNSPSEAIDVYINDILYVNDFQFRSATSYLFLPIGRSTIKVADEKASSPKDAFAQFEVNLESFEDYIFMFGGEQSGLLPFDLFQFKDAREYADTRNTVGISFANGAINANSLDFLTLGVPLYNDISYGEFGSFISVPMLNYEIDIVSSNDREDVLASHNLNLDFWQGRSALIYTSGYHNGGEPEMQTYISLSDGTTYPLEEIEVVPQDTQFANVQFIHNAFRENVDFYVDENLLLENFVYRNATTFQQIPAGRAVEFAVARRGSASVADAAVVQEVTFEKDQYYVVFINGKVGLGDIDVQLLIDDAKADANNRDRVSLKFANTGGNLPKVDVIASGAIIFSNVDVDECSDYFEYRVRPIELTLALHNDRRQVFGVFDSDFRFWRGRSAILFPSGDQNSITSPLELHVALSNGSSFALPPVNNGNSVESRNVSHFEVTAQDQAILLNLGETISTDAIIRVFTPTGQLLKTQHWSPQKSDIVELILSNVNGLVFVSIQTEQGYSVQGVKI